MTSELKNSPFYNLQLAVNPDIEWSPWAGCKTPVAIHELDDELRAVRNGTIVFDMSPVVKYQVTGTDAQVFLDKISTRSMAIKPGRVTYTCWTNAQGMLVDDGTVFRFSETEFRMLPNSRDDDYYAQQAEGLDVEVTDVSHNSAALTVQGKTAATVLTRMGIKNLVDMKPFDFATFDSPAGELMISRTGFFGDLGYELWFSLDQVEAVWDAVLAAGALPVGIVTLCNARLEAGHIIPDNEFELEPAKYDGSEPDSFNRTPFDLGLGFVINLDKGDFVGRDALIAEKERGSTWQLVALELDCDHGAAQRDVVAVNGVEVGFVTSGLFSVNLGKSIALATVKSGSTSPGGSASVVVNGVKVDAVVVDTPFYKSPRKAQTPAPML
ncbi:aminomethyltransferase [Luminiphilus syltensis NOR5-1B]|uniref:Aminomethyltransferase n=1 Tax=Luminiphilus syltensis NOR5-1B TaxID=565045 RepID=B8KX81_9GAMM|nr:aminomethyltransferase family protein [Luminiphilus syltensis]EED35309.1 aminomethyltransferase [Luminiphilus syltensis NOR5-1B]